jgi:Protein of unknown function (DUF3223)
VTKKAITDRCKVILNTAPQKSEITGVDADLVLVILGHHPKAARWPASQGGVNKITVGRWAGRYHTPCFYLHYANGEVWDFSLYKCVRNMNTADVRTICQRFGLQ